MVVSLNIEGIIAECERRAKEAEVAAQYWERLDAPTTAHGQAMRVIAFREALDLLRIAPSPPPPDTVRVRAIVGIDGAGNYVIDGSSAMTDDDLRRYIHSVMTPDSIAWITADIPRPTEPEIQATVEVSP